jgi:hypothetical protein
MVRVLPQTVPHEDAIGSHLLAGSSCKRVPNAISPQASLPCLTVSTVHSAQTRKARSADQVYSYLRTEVGGTTSEHICTGFVLLWYAIGKVVCVVCFWEGRAGGLRLGRSPLLGVEALASLRLAAWIACAYLLLLEPSSHRCYPNVHHNTEGALRPAQCPDHKLCVAALMTPHNTEVSTSPVP